MYLYSIKFIRNDDILNICSTLKLKYKFLFILENIEIIIWILKFQIVKMFSTLEMFKIVWIYWTLNEISEPETDFPILKIKGASTLKHHVPDFKIVQRCLRLIFHIDYRYSYCSRDIIF